MHSHIRLLAQIAGIFALVLVAGRHYAGRLHGEEPAATFRPVKTDYDLGPVFSKTWRWRVSEAGSRETAEVAETRRARQVEWWQCGCHRGAGPREPPSARPR